MTTPTDPNARAAEIAAAVLRQEAHEYVPGPVTRPGRTEPQCANCGQGKTAQFHPVPSSPIRRNHRK